VQDGHTESWTSWLPSREWFRFAVCLPFYTISIGKHCHESPIFCTLFSLSKIQKNPPPWERWHFDVRDLSQNPGAGSRFNAQKKSEQTFGKFDVFKFTFETWDQFNKVKPLDLLQWQSSKKFSGYARVQIDKYKYIYKFECKGMCKCKGKWKLKCT
jgi:hypothetical protein